MHSDAFDVIPYEDIKGEWKKLGSGSFGNVYKGRYLGIDVAIKEVLPSQEYDVAKYFEREWRLMKESRHPNIVLFLGLSRAPDPDNRIFIVSEFIENGNLRLYIHDKSKPMPWRLRLSFATDITRALAYLHARKCIHRDLKGENLLILLGDEFDLPTDIFSLGIIFCEIIARRLADDHHFKRTAPSFGVSAEEVHSLASPGCPPDMLALCIDCCAVEPSARPTTREILERLRLIEVEVLARLNEDEDSHVGSIKFMTGGKRPHPGPRIPSFGVGVGKDIRASGSTTDDSDDELMEAVLGLSKVGVDSDWSDTTAGRQPLLDGEDSEMSEYSTTVIKSHGSQPPSLSSILTIRGANNPDETPHQGMPPASDSLNSPSPSSMLEDHGEDDLLGTSSIMSIDSLDSYHTAAGSAISSAYATEGGSTIRSLHGNYVAPMVHRFTLLKPGAKPKKNSISGTGALTPTGSGGETTWNPLDLIFSSGLLVAKCDVCAKRLGWKPVLECDDCGMKAHIKCGEVAPRDCGIRPPQTSAMNNPVTKVKESSKSKSASPSRR
ncbi:kinase-like protein [Hymenopellis radicata]|nr:kinase-like protein [Hymenopellis radicata]